jgi:hypothetical protein
MHTHKGLSISLRNLSSNHGRERERRGRTLAFSLPRVRMGKR